MTNTHLLAVSSILSTSLFVSQAKICLSSTKLSGGTEAAGVYRVVATFTDDLGKPKRQRVVVKRLTGRARREAGIMHRLAARGDCRLLPKLVGHADDGRENTFLVMEEIRPASAWPWRSNKATEGLLQELGAFHDVNPTSALTPNCWDYEAELLVGAQRTLRDIQQASRYSDFSELKPSLRIIDKVVSELPRLRRALLQEPKFGARLIHGDVHPGNAIVRDTASRTPVLIDWGRTRIGSPLEDVSSMLQSLRMYEPAALQRHDALFKSYLEVSHGERRIGDTARSAYWVAGASNALAGAVSWHLMIASDPNRSDGQRAVAYSAVKDWLRIIRRAHAWAL